MIGGQRKIIIEKWTQAKNDTGSLTDTLVERHFLWAEVSKTSESRQYSGNQVQQFSSFTFKVRFRSDWALNDLWKVVYQGKRFTVQQIDNINERSFNWLITAKSASDGSNN